MNPQVLLELAAKWESKNEELKKEPVQEGEELASAAYRGIISARHACIEDLRLLIKLLAR